MKRSALNRGNALLRRTPLGRGRKRLTAKPLSPEEAGRRALVRAAVFDRDGRRCLLASAGVGSCWGEPRTPHHLLKSVHGGPYVRSNLVTLCAGHNTWVEDNPDAAHQLGLVRRRGDSLVDCWARMVDSGLVTYGPLGEPLQGAKLRDYPDR